MKSWTFTAIFSTVALLNTFSKMVLAKAELETSTSCLTSAYMNLLRLQWTLRKRYKKKQRQELEHLHLTLEDE